MSFLFSDISKFGNIIGLCYYPTIQPYSGDLNSTQFSMLGIY